MLNAPQSYTIIVTLAVCVVDAAVDTYLFLRLKELGGGGYLMGSAAVVQIASEIPCFYYSGALYTLFGCRWLQLTSLILYGVRQLWYSFDWHSAWWCGLPAELLHGVTYSIFNSATTTFMQETAPPDLAVTAQAVLSSAQSGVGSGLASVVAGELYQRFGSRTMYRYCGVSMLGAAIVFSLCGAFVDGYAVRRSKQKGTIRTV